MNSARRQPGLVQAHRAVRLSVRTVSSHLDRIQDKTGCGRQPPHFLGPCDGGYRSCVLTEQRNQAAD
jgi:hypothetical protein